MYAILTEIMASRPNSLFTAPIGVRYLAQTTYQTRQQAVETAEAMARKSPTRKCTVVELSVIGEESSFYFPPQEKKYAAVFN